MYIFLHSFQAQKPTILPRFRRLFAAFRLCGLAGLFLIGMKSGKAQDSLLVSKNFHFRNGIYLTLDAFRQNEPDFPWEAVEAGYFLNPQTFLISVEYIKLNSPDALHPYLDVDAVWGMVIDGIPYVRLEEAPAGRSIPTFAALKVRGRICYFTYLEKRKVRFPMSAYNPVNGRPFRTGLVERQMDVKVEKMLHFETGEVADFTFENFLQWIQDDPALAASVADFTEEEASKKLFKCLLIYDDRNEVFVPGSLKEALENKD
ncbi:MAG: hypothetical protein D6714_16790 [Bacteroidetes bacterium]|nr:MAG: hypothetical protein D6714_16790 [Bacteroidota bacterium]